MPSRYLMRQDGVPAYSNHAGIPSPTFVRRVAERLEQVRTFLTVQPSGPSGTKPPTETTDFIVESTPDTILIAGYPFATESAVESQGRLTVVLKAIAGQAEAELRNLSPRAARVEIAYGNTAIRGHVEECLQHLLEVLVVHRPDIAQCRQRLGCEPARSAHSS